MTKWYVGYRDENAKFGEVFGSDDPKEATPEASGYAVVDGPFNTQEQAEKALSA